jgi:hypothetical protein
MKVTTVRFSETLYGTIEEQARREGVSTAQFIREAAILRLGQLMAERGPAEARPARKQRVPATERSITRRRASRARAGSASS